MSHLELVALVVRDYEPAIDFFVNVLGFELVEDIASLTNDGRAKRWVVVRPDHDGLRRGRHNFAYSESWRQHWRRDDHRHERWRVTRERHRRTWSAGHVREQRYTTP